MRVIHNILERPVRTRRRSETPAKVTRHRRETDAPVKTTRSYRAPQMGELVRVLGDSPGARYIVIGFSEVPGDQPRVELMGPHGNFWAYFSHVRPSTD